MGLLEEILATLSQGGSHTTRELAWKLAITEEMVVELLGELSKLGYLRKLESISQECSAKTADCCSCPLAGECRVTGAGKAWALTNKGSKAAHRWRSS